LRPEFDARGVRIVAISPETPSQIARGREKHGLQAVMLADRALEITDRFGLRNRGIHSGPPPPAGPEALPVPTSLLIGPNGDVLWMDQSENYQRRSDPEYVLGALREHLG
jgi:peroxiredoxin